MLGLPGMACSTVIMRALYALSMPREAFKVTLFSVVSTAIFSLILIYPMSYNGLALAPGIAFTLSGMLGLYFVRKKLNMPLRIITKKFFWDYLTALTVLDASIMIFRFIMPYNPEAGLLIRASWCLGVIILAAVSYGLTAMKMNSAEFDLLKEAVKFTKKN